MRFLRDIALSFLVMMASCSFAWAQDESKPLADQERELLKECFDLATSVYRENVKDYESGRAISFAVLLESKKALIDAKLELAVTEQERLDALRESVTDATGFLEIVEARVRASLANTSELTKARYDVAHSKLQLVREKRKQATKP